MYLATLPLRPLASWRAPEPNPSRARDETPTPDAQPGSQQPAQQPASQINGWLSHCVRKQRPLLLLPPCSVLALCGIRARGDRTLLERRPCQLMRRRWRQLAANHRSTVRLRACRPPSPLPLCPPPPPPKIHSRPCPPASAH